jgi:hypothetical protein
MAKKPTIVSILARITLLDGSTVEYKMVGTTDPRLGVYKDTVAQGLLAKLEVVKSVATHDVIEVVEMPKKN